MTSLDGTSLRFRRSCTCQWNFQDPPATKAGDAKQGPAFKRVLRQILRRVSGFIALPVHARNATARLRAANAIAETAFVSIAID